MRRNKLMLTILVAGVAAVVAAGCNDAIETVDTESPGANTSKTPDWQFENNSEASDRRGDLAEVPTLETDRPIAETVDPESSSPSGYVAHEWGTFTSVVDSNGTYLPGLHHQGVALPAFVHDFDFSGPVPGERINPDRQGPHLPQPATQKLETPVIYFYTDQPRDVRVEVDFPKGFITKWYPDAVDMWPLKPDCIYCSTDVRIEHGLDRLADGRMTWDVSLTNADQHDSMVEVPPDDIWAPSRRVPDAAYVQHGSETDKFIFYRGLGRASLPFEITAEETRTGPEFTFENQSDQAIPAVYLLHITEERGRIVDIGGIEPGDSKTHDPAPKELRTETFVQRAKHVVEQGLIDTGLTENESEAMVETWAHSYFRATGYRVLYVLPRAWTDRLLPIDIEPTPDRLVRTIVGRVEVITPGVARETLDQIRQAHQEGRRLEDVYRGGRFEEPHFRRACQLATSDELNTWCDEQLRMLAAETISEDGFHGY